MKTVAFVLQVVALILVCLAFPNRDYTLLIWAFAAIQAALLLYIVSYSKESS